MQSTRLHIIHEVEHAPVGTGRLARETACGPFGFLEAHRGRGISQLNEFGWGIPTANLRRGHFLGVALLMQLFQEFFLGHTLVVVQQM